MTEHITTGGHYLLTLFSVKQQDVWRQCSPPKLDLFLPKDYDDSQSKDSF